MCLHVQHDPAIAIMNARTAANGSCCGCCDGLAPLEPLFGCGWDVNNKPSLPHCYDPRPTRASLLAQLFFTNTALNRHE